MYKLGNCIIQKLLSLLMAKIFSWLCTFHNVQCKIGHFLMDVVHIIKSNEKKYTPSLHWIVRKKIKTGVEDMEFPGQGRPREKIMQNFEGSCFLVLEFLRDVTHFCTIPRGGALISLEFPGEVQKSMSLTHPPLVVFL